MATIKKWKDALKRPDQVEALDLDVKQLPKVRFPQHRVLPAEIGRFTALRSLRIRTRNLAELCPEFAGLQALESLSMDPGEVVFQFRDELAALPALRELELYDLGLTGPIALPPSLEVLRICDESALDPDAWLPTLAGLPRLGELDLCGSLSSGVPDGIGDLSQLHTLVLAGNQLTDLPAALARLGGLQVLKVHNNQLTAVPAAVRGLTGLRTLMLDHNPLAEVPAWIGELSSLSTLGLSVTGLTDLPPAVLSLPLETFYVDVPPDVLTRIQAALPACKVVCRTGADVDREVQGWLRFMGKA